MSLPKLSIMVVVLLLLANDPAVTSDDVVHFDDGRHGTLPEETGGGPPPRWINTNLKGRGSDAITLAMRGDNVRFPRIVNQDGTWHACRSDGLHGLTPAARLSFDDDYASLLGGHEKLKDLRIGKEAALDAISVLARFRATTNRTDAAATAADDVAARRAWATLRVAISEPLRFKSIAQSVGAAWENGGTTLDDRQVKLVADDNWWRTMSCALLIAAQNGGAWRSEEADRLRSIGMFSKKDVLAEIDLIMWPKDCSQPITLRRSRTTRGSM